MSWHIENIVFWYCKAGCWDWYVRISARLTRTKLVISPILSRHMKRKEAESHEGDHRAHASTSTVTVGSSHCYTLYSLLRIIFIFLRHHVDVNLLSKLSDSKPSFILMLCASFRLLLLLDWSNMIPLVFFWAHSWTCIRDLLHFEFLFFFC